MSTRSYIERYGLDWLNSATKYPSIPTYHPLGDKGRLKDEAPIQFGEHWVATEKIDGTNARIIMLPGIDNVLVGSREEILHSYGDLVWNPQMGIVEHLRPKISCLPRISEGSIWVFYGEIYGGKVTANSKQYTRDGNVGFRVFDVAEIALQSIEGLSKEVLAIRRESSNTFQIFQGVETTLEFCLNWGFEVVKTVVGSHRDLALPQGLEETHGWLKTLLPKTNCDLDEGANPGKAEGLVIRTRSRSVIAKARFEDYERTLRMKAFSGMNKF